MKRATLEKDWKRLVAMAKAEGFHLNFHGKQLLKDFAGMNYEAAQAMGYPEHDPEEIIIDVSLPLKRRVQNLRHEIVERTIMKDTHCKYWTAHIQALRAEKAPLGEPYKIPGSDVIA